MSKLEVVGGWHAVRAVLESTPERVKRLQIAMGREDARLRECVALAQTHGIPVERVRPERMGRGDASLQALHHQGVLAWTQARILPGEEHLDGLLAVGNVLLLALDGVTDPHNLGACLRAADAAGVAAVIVPRDQSCGLTPAAVKAASGAAETIPLIGVTNLARTLRRLQKSGVWVVGLAGEAETLVYAMDLRLPTVLVMGSEGEGLRRLTREVCDHLVRIPMQGHLSSLNVSVAAGISLFEAVRQRGVGAGAKGLERGE